MKHETGHERARRIPWRKPAFQEIRLDLEVTAYVNTDDTPPATIATDRHGGERCVAASPRSDAGAE